MWNGFDLIPDSNLHELASQLDLVLNQLDDEQEKCKDSKPYPSYYDDVCLARFFKGLVTRELAMPSSQMLVPEREQLKIQFTDNQLEQFRYSSRQLEYISLQADDIEYDHWILPFSRYELGHLYSRLGDYDRAKAEYQAALNGGYGEDEAGKQKVKPSMEASLHLRVHNAMQKVNLLQTLKQSPTSGDEILSQDNEDTENDSD
jgi:hypothetical protein